MSSHQLISEHVSDVLYRLDQKRRSKEIKAGVYTVMDDVAEIQVKQQGESSADDFFTKNDVGLDR